MRRLLILVLAVGLVAAACDSGSGKSENDTTTSEKSAADSRIDDLYQDCEDGDDDACDDLYTESEVGSPEEAFGNNCGGRGLPPGEQWCGPERQAQDAAAEPEPEPAPEPTDPPPDTSFNRDAARAEFVDACVATGGESSRDRCGCSFDYILANYGAGFFDSVTSDSTAILNEANAVCS